MNRRHLDRATDHVMRLPHAERRHIIDQAIEHARQAQLARHNSRFGWMRHARSAVTFAAALVAASLVATIASGWRNDTLGHTLVTLGLVVILLVVARSRVRRNAVARNGLTDLATRGEGPFSSDLYDMSIPWAADGTATATVTVKGGATQQLTFAPEGDADQAAMSAEFSRVGVWAALSFAGSYGFALRD